jgi:hypothetical protein
LITKSTSDLSEIKTIKSAREFTSFSNKIDKDFKGRLQVFTSRDRFGLERKDSSRRSSVDSEGSKRSGKNKSNSPDKLMRATSNKLTTFMNTTGSFGIGNSSTLSQSDASLKKKMKDPVMDLRKTLENYHNAKQHQLEVLSDTGIRALLEGTYSPTFTILTQPSPVKSPMLSLGSNASKEARKKELIKKKIQLYELRMVFFIFSMT